MIDSVMDDLTPRQREPKLALERKHQPVNHGDRVQIEQDWMPVVGRSPLELCRVLHVRRIPSFMAKVNSYFPLVLQA